MSEEKRLKILYALLRMVESNMNRAESEKMREYWIERHRELVTKIVLLTKKF